MGCLMWLLVILALFSGGIKLAWMVLMFLLVFNWIMKF